MSGTVICGLHREPNLVVAALARPDCEGTGCEILDPSLVETVSLCVSVYTRVQSERIGRIVVGFRRLEPVLR